MDTRIVTTLHLSENHLMKVLKYILLFIVWLCLLFRATANNTPLPVKSTSVTGVISSLPLQLSHSQSFTIDSNLGRLKLSWFKSSQEVKLGERWMFTVKLKPPHGYHNPGGFNLERWLLAQHIVAVGSVVDKGINKKLSETHSIRSNLIKSLDLLLAQNAYKDIILALTLGLSSLLTSSHTDIFQHTGTAHLMAISGLHIGMVAAMVFRLMSVLTRCYTPILLYFPKQKIAAISAILAAILYSALAGFAVSTERSVIMICVSMLSYYFFFKKSMVTSLMIAFLVIIFLDPLVIYVAGFWLSFSAVFFLIYTMSSRLGKERVFWQWSRAQIVCSIALIPLTAWYFHGFSCLSIVANLIAIPLVSFIVVPCSLLGIVFLKITLLSKLFISVATFTLHYLLLYLGYLTIGQLYFSLHTMVEFLAAITAVLVLFLPAGMRLKSLAAFCLLPIFFPTKNSLQAGQFELTVLDVGQGLSCIVQTQRHSLVFDTGAKFDEFDIGKNIVVPYLKFEGINKIDTIVVSHGDNDHAGGLDSIMNEYQSDELYTSDYLSLHHSSVLCERKISWWWDGVYFDFENDATLDFKKDNNNCCVLKITGAAGNVLLTGDIEKQAEKALLARPVRSTAIVVPHHGSKTSSTQEFIEAVKPCVAIFSFGFLNRFHHPSPEVVERYKFAGAKILSTVSDGAIKLRY